MSQVFPIGGAGLSIMGGFSQARALKTEAKQIERSRKDEELRGKQISAIRREQTNEALATIDAVRVSRGLSIDGPGGVNIRRVNRDRARENENAEVLSSKNRQETLKTQAAMKRRAAPFAVLSGFASAASSLATVEWGGE
jgi:hypothetical protein